MTLGRTALRYRAVTSGSTFVYQTGTQVVPLTQSGTGAVSWTATSNVGWLQVSPASGTGPANLQIAVVPSGLPAIGNRRRIDHVRVHGRREQPRADYRRAQSRPERRLGLPLRHRRHADRQSHRRDRRHSVHRLAARRRRRGAGDDLPFGVWRRSRARSTRTAAVPPRSSSASARSSKARGPTSRRRTPPIPGTTRRAGGSWC